MTFKSVGERARINERTVRRHFPTERALRDAIQQRLFAECGVDFDKLDLSNFADAAVRVHRYLMGFALASQEPPDPGFTAMDRQRRGSLMRLVAGATPSWTSEEQRIAAAMLDLLWTPVNFERLSSAWNLDRRSIARLIHWSVHLLQEAVIGGKRPPSEIKGRKRRARARLT
jgi:AcrR family transcriptional regulator